MVDLIGNGCDLFLNQYSAISVEEMMKIMYASGVPQPGL
jgi:hypothetical protein